MSGNPIESIESIETTVNSRGNGKMLRARHPRRREMEKGSKNKPRETPLTRNGWIHQIWFHFWFFFIFSSFNFHQKLPSNQETRRLSSTARSKHPKARRSGDAMAHNSPEAKEVESACPNSPSHWTILDFQLPAAKFVAGNLNYASNLKWSMLRTWTWIDIVKI